MSRVCLAVIVSVPVFAAGASAQELDLVAPGARVGHYCLLPRRHRRGIDRGPITARTSLYALEMTVTGQ